MVYKGEKHAWLFTTKGVQRANYCGPGTQLERRLKQGDTPVSNMDAICQRHDIAYANAYSAKEIRAADNQMLSEMDQDPWINPIEKTVIGGFMRTKIAGEKIGVFGPETFTKLPNLRRKRKRKPFAVTLFEYENMGNKACKKRDNLRCYLDEQERNWQQTKTTKRRRKL